MFYGNQFQSSIDYLECVDIDGKINNKKKKGRMYDENYMPINEALNSITLSIMGAKVNTSTFAAKLNDGRQVWSEVRKETIRDGGINDVPHIFNNNTGLKNK